MKPALALITIIRPQNVAIAAVSVIAGAVTGPGSSLHWSPLAWAILSVTLMAAGANTLNDVADVQVDSVNKPHRPLPGGSLSVPIAAIWAVVLLLGGVATAFSLPAACKIIVLFWIAAIPVYDLWGKGWPLVGNLMVSTISSLAFLYGSLAVGRGLWGLIPCVLAFFFHFGREIIKDMEDMDADREGGRKTWPHLVGEKMARRTAQTVLLILLLILAMPVVLQWLGIWYLVVALPGVGIPIVIIVAGLSRHPGSTDYGRFQRILKWDMLVGLLAVLVG